MKIIHLNNLKAGDKIKYKLRKIGDIYTGIVKAIKKCRNCKDGRCDSHFLNNYYIGKRCIGQILIYRNGKYSNSRCGVEDGWSLQDPVIEDFLSMEDMVIK